MSENPEKFGTLFEGGQQVKRLLLEAVIKQDGMDRAAAVFGMLELIVDMKPEGAPLREWAKEVVRVFSHFVNQKENLGVKH